MTYLRRVFAIATKRKVLESSLQIALVVGAILNLINQGGAIWGDARFSIGHFFMNFAVPFCVASFSAAKNEIARAKDHCGPPR